MAARRKTRPHTSDRGLRRPEPQWTREPIHLCVEGQGEEQYLRAPMEYRHPKQFAPKFIGDKGRRQGRKISLINLVKAAEKYERAEQLQEVIWIVCDVDRNKIHCGELERWRREGDNHRSTLQSAALEGWLLQHLDNPGRPFTATEAISMLKAQWSRYVKGCDIPEWLIKCTDEACRREKHFLGGQNNSGVWPVDRSSQMPALIEYLDERARRRDQRA